MSNSEKKSHENGNYELILTIEGREYNWSEQYITGRQLRQLAGIKASQEIYLSLTDPWDDELISDDDKVDLGRPGIESFYVRHPLKITINGNPFDWKSQYITGKQLRKLGNVQEDHDLFLDLKGPFDDEPISDQSVVDLARPGTEHFYSKERCTQVEIIVNGRQKEWGKKTVSFEQLVVLAFGNYSDNGTTAYTVTYKRGPKENPEGSMVRGDIVFVKDKMIFNVTATDRS